MEFHFRCAKLCNDKHTNGNAAVAATGGTLMARKSSIVTMAFVAFVAGAGLAGTSGAQDCPRGDLDKAYCDRDGDLVADTPTDAKQLVNPPTLIFAYTPVEDPAVYTKVWDGFIKHMEKITGKKVVFFPVQSNAAEIEAMRSGRLHIAGFNTGSNADCGQLCWLCALRHHGRQGWQLRLRNGNYRAGRQRDQNPGRHQGQEAGVHRADVEFRIQGAIRPARIGIQSDREARLRAGVFRQA